MKVQPTPEQWNTLTVIERFNFKVTHALNSSAKFRRLLTRIGATFGKWWVECCTSKIVLDHGFDNFKKINPEKGVLLVANHRSFFDHFVISARLFRLYGPHHNIYFPVRANFFYDNLLGLIINLKAALGVMYPPIIRDVKRRKWNIFATDLMVELLKDADNMVGFHPEGTRNKGADPYSLLPAKPGCGELIYRAQPNIVPVFLQGFPDSVLPLLRKNLSPFYPKEPIVHMVMGEPVDVTSELALPPSNKTYLAISRRIMDEICRLSVQEKEIRARYEH